MSNEAEINNLIAVVQQKNPALFSALQLMNNDLYTLFNAFFPSPDRPRKVGGGILFIRSIQLFTLNVFANNLQLSWTLVDGATRYEIRLGTDWDSAAHIIFTTASSVNLDPIGNNFIYGTYTFLIKGSNLVGIESENAATVSFSVPLIPAPALTGSAIANNALLYWDTPSSIWQIKTYNIIRDGVVVTQSNSNFTLYSELAAGTHSYSVQAIDIVGNLSTPSEEVTLSLLGPIDYILHSNIPATYAGTYSNSALDSGDRIIGPVPAGESWDDHFSTRGWTNIQDQIDAGYPIYAQPAELTGYYEEDFDFGVIVDNATVVVTFNKIKIYLDTIITTTIEGSTDGITWSSPVTSNTAFFAAIRYARIRWIFDNGMNDLPLAYIYNLRCLLDIQLTLDSGSITANAGDVGGTTVTFNKNFSQVNSITLAVDSPNVRTAVYQTVTTTNFKVLVFNSAGARQTETISWKARGVI